MKARIGLLVCALAATVVWSEAPPAGSQSASGALGPQVVKPEHFAVTPPLRDLPPLAINAQPTNQAEEEEPHRLPKADYGKGQPWQDGALSQKAPIKAAAALMPAATTYAGINYSSSGCGCQPPDPNGDVGLTQYVETVNGSYGVYNKSTGANLMITSLQNLWSSLSGSACANNNDGDPIVLYDRAADRWLVSQFAIPGGTTGYHQCIAISKTNDATGQWYTWDFLWSTSTMNDYPHFGIWPDGYYMSTNQFANGSSWAGQGVAVFERAAMLAGNAGARMVKFDVGSGTSAHNLDYGGQLPSDMEGPTPPSAGMPNLFIEADNQTFPGDTQAHLRLWKFHVDWSNTGNSTFGVDNSTYDPNYVLPIANFTYMPTCGSGSNCIPQKGTNSKVDDLADRMMYRANYHNFGPYESITTSFTVEASSSGQAGIRWWELRNLSTTPTVYQEQTYSPDTALYRWMGTSAMNKAGDLAFSYSGSSSNVYPSLYISGRYAGDLLNSLAQGEGTLYAGTASQTSGSRWGDYASMKVDPSDDCTFWFTGEYSTGGGSWATRFGKLKMVPLAPAAPTFAPVASSTLTVNWAASGGGATYDVYRAAGSSCAGATKVNASPVTGSSYMDSGLTPSTPYSYYVVGNDACGSSPNGACATVTTAAAAALRVPYSVTPMQITKAANNNLTWDAKDCPSTNYHVIYGWGSTMGNSPAVVGGQCQLGSSGTATWTPPDPSSDPSHYLWFFVVGDDGASTEGPWGLTSEGTAASGVIGSCNFSVKNTTGVCSTN